MAAILKKGIWIPFPSKPFQVLDTWWGRFLLKRHEDAKSVTYATPPPHPKIIETKDDLYFFKDSQNK